MEEKLNKLRTGVILVKPEEKKVIEEKYSEKINQWRKRKRIFKELWDAITENSPKDVKEFKVLPFVTQSLVFMAHWNFTYSARHFVMLLQEELGLEYDEDVGVSLQSYAELNNASKKRKPVHW